MGYVDCDAHVLENDSTWDHLDPDEREFRPRTLRDVDLGLEEWVVSDYRLIRMDRVQPVDAEKFDSIYAPGTADLSDVGARVAHMDRLGQDVQVVFSTFFIQAEWERPLVHAALARSWNRWMAEKHAASGGRICWALNAPLQMMDRAFEEMEFGKAHGAVGIHIRGEVHGMVLDDEYLRPFYAKAQELELAVIVHVGLNSRIMNRDPRGVFPMVTQVITGFHRLVVSDVPERFPGIRWGFVEASASWLPFAMQEAARATELGARRTDDNTDAAWDEIRRRNLYVATQIEDDLPYLLRFAGPDNFIVGSDYGHLDVGADVDAAGIIARRTDIDPDVATRIVDTNGRRLYRIDPSFTPTGPTRVAVPA